MPRRKKRKGNGAVLLLWMMILVVVGAALLVLRDKGFFTYLAGVHNRIVSDEVIQTAPVTESTDENVIAKTDEIEQKEIKIPEDLHEEKIEEKVQTETEPETKPEEVIPEVKDEKVVEKKVAPPLPISSTPGFPNRSELDIATLNALSNEDLSWWYVVPERKHEEVPAKIRDEIATLISRYNSVWQLPPTGEKTVYLTMDEGYEFEDNTTRILDIAKEKGVPITFFITGGFIDSHPQLVVRMREEGHIVANHTMKHLRGAKALDKGVDVLVNDIVGLEEKYRNLTGYELAPLMRPPEGGYSERSLAVINALGYRPVFWSFAYKDWETDNQPSKDYAFEFITGQLHDGSVMLLHAVSKTNVEVLGELIDYVRANGYTFGTIPY